MNIHSRTTKDVTLGTLVHGFLLLISHPAFAAPVVVTTTTTEDIAHDKTSPQFHFSGTSLIDSCRLLRISMLDIIFPYTRIFYLKSINIACMNRTTADRTYFATTIKATTDNTTEHLDMRMVHITVSHITATEYVATHVQLFIARFSVIQLRLILFIDISS